MKQFKLIWLPLLGVIFIIMWLKVRELPMYIDEFILWVIYQSFIFYLIISFMTI